MTNKTLQERLRERAKNIWAAHIPKDEGMFPQMDLLGEAADALDAQEARIKALEGAMRFVKDDLENCDWSCERCSKDYEMKDTDIYLTATRALLGEK